MNPILLILGGFAFKVADGDSRIMFATAKYEHNSEPKTIKRAT
jgi:hypothetical protein